MRTARQQKLLTIQYIEVSFQRRFPRGVEMLTWKAHYDVKHVKYDDTLRRVAPLSLMMSCPLGGRRYVVFCLVGRTHGVIGIH